MDEVVVSWALQPYSPEAIIAAVLLTVRYCWRSWLKSRDYHAALLHRERMADKDHSLAGAVPDVVAHWAPTPFEVGPLKRTKPSEARSPRQLPRNEAA
jgi:hypothetical protein